MKLISLVLLLVEAALAQTAPPVTGIQAMQQNGQTFITWTDAATGVSGANYRYNLYRSTACPITSTASATLVEQGLYNNSGQLIGPLPYNQATRQDTDNAMVTLNNLGTQLAPWTGVAVYTQLAKATACYAVITHDTTGATSDSPISAGVNSMLGTVSESVAAIEPILQLPGTASSRAPTSDCIPNGTTCTTGVPLGNSIGRSCNAASTYPGVRCVANSQCHNGACSVPVPSSSAGLPLTLKLHPSGGRADPYGDLYSYWGNSTMSYQDGTQATFSVYSSHEGLIDPYCIGGPNAARACELGPAGDAFCSPAKCDGGTFANELIVSPQDAAWSVDGTTGAQTYWWGNNSTVPINSAAPNYTYSFTQNKLNLVTGFAISNYGADVNRIYGIGSSMGGYGTANWSLRQYSTFAAVWLRDAINGPWQQIVNLLPSSTATIATTNANLLPNPPIPYNAVTDTEAWVPQNCSRNLPYVGMSAGRQDMTVSNMWLYTVQLANALKSCHYAFSFAWNNGVHGTATEALALPLQSQYEPLIYKNRSMPAFTSFSLDSNYGSGTDRSDGDCATGATQPCYVNYGWYWTPPTETASSWSVSFSNVQVTSTATVNVTARNTQSFKPAAGTMISWTATGGQSGTVTTDSYGLVTVPLTIGPGTTTLTLVH